MKLMFWKLLRLVDVLVFLASAVVGILFLVSLVIASLTAIFSNVTGYWEVILAFLGFVVFFAIVCVCCMKLYTWLDDKIKAEQPEGEKARSGCFEWLLTLVVIGAIVYFLCFFNVPGT